MRDVMHDIRVVPAIAPVVVVDNTDTVSSIIDMQGPRDADVLRLSRYPVTSIASVVIDATALDPASDWELDPDRRCSTGLDRSALARVGAER